MAYHFHRCQIIPLADQQVSFEVDGRQVMRWHHGASYPRPFFYPIHGPSGASLTRMGHPGAANHDHHRSVWFAHNKVLGIDFWSDATDARVRQLEWLCYKDGDDEAIMSSRLGWYDGHDPKPLIEQELVAAVCRDEKNQWQLELQATFKPVADMLEFGQTNFGFLAVRVAKSLSAYFGGGQLTNSEGRVGEAAIFGHAARWMDYSGPVPGDKHAGITYFDHPQNPKYPTRWHVREDGWMGASACMNEAIVTTRENPLVLRYMLDIHDGLLDVERADRLAEGFHQRQRFVVEKATVKHQQYDVRRRMQ